MKKIYFLVVAAIVPLLLAVGSFIHFVVTGKDMYPSDYVMVDERVLQDEILILDVKEKITYDSLGDIAISLFNSGAKVIVMTSPSRYFEGDESGFIKTLERSDDQFAVPEIFDSHLDNDAHFLGENLYETSKNYSAHNLVTEFDKTPGSSGFPHIAYLAAKAYHPRYKYSLEQSNANSFDIRYFGNEYWSFFVGGLHEFEEMIKPHVANRIVIIGSVGDLEHYTVLRYHFQNKDFGDKPDMSDPILVANAILSVLNREILYYPKLFPDF